MSMTTQQALITIGAMVLGTMVTRFLPFILFPDGRKAPQFITYLGKALPYSVVAFLVVYCLKGVDLRAFPHGAPEAAAIGAMALLHVWRKDTLLSIAAGTAIYMFLVQRVFL